MVHLVGYSPYVLLQQIISLYQLDFHLLSQSYQKAIESSPATVSLWINLGAVMHLMVTKTLISVWTAVFTCCLMII